MELAGKVAIVTGGGRGIGRAVALELGRAGAKVVGGYTQGAEPAQAVAADQGGGDLEVGGGGQQAVGGAQVPLPVGVDVEHAEDGGGRGVPDRGFECGGHGVGPFADGRHEACVGKGMAAGSEADSERLKAAGTAPLGTAKPLVTR